MRRATIVGGAGNNTIRISIHALLAESDAPPYNLMIQHPKFLSTLSLRRATGRHRGDNRSPVHFYPRSPCGERLWYSSASSWLRIISIHALLAESDVVETQEPKPTRQFLSTLSLRRATVGTSQVFQRIAISIHALLAESDITYQRQVDQKSNFYPRSPCGERQSIGTLGTVSVKISIHALLAESDENTLSNAINRSISIHALLAESDLRPEYFLT